MLTVTVGSGGKASTGTTEEMNTLVDIGSTVVSVVTFPSVVDVVTTSVVTFTITGDALKSTNQ